MHNCITKWRPLQMQSYPLNSSERLASEQASLWADPLERLPATRLPLISEFELKLQLKLKLKLAR